MDDDRRRSTIGGGQRCEHPLDDRTYLGHMGRAAFHRCTSCDAVVVAWPSGTETETAAEALAD